jgi:hypothetical protein
MDRGDINQDGVVKLVNILSENKDWYNKDKPFIRDDTTKRPYLCKDGLIKKLKNSGFEKLLTNDTNIKLMYQMFVDKNNDLSTRGEKYFRTKNEKICKRFADAQAMGFFLGLDKSFKYIDELKEKMESIIIKNEQFWTISDKLYEYVKDNIPQVIDKLGLIKLEKMIKDNLSTYVVKLSIPKENRKAKYIIDKYVIPV